MRRQLDRSAFVLTILLALAPRLAAQISDDQARSSGPGHPWQGGPADVNPWSHALETRIALVAWRGHDRTSVEFTLYHNSQSALPAGPLGPKWAHTYSTCVETWTDSNGTERAAVLFGDHTVALFSRQGGRWVNDDGYRHRLEDAAGGFVLTADDHARSFFEPTTTPFCSRLQAIEDRSGNRVSLGYDSAGRLVVVSDGSARELRFAYGSNAANAPLVEMTCQGMGFGPRFTFTYDLIRRLQSVAWPPVNQAGAPVRYSVLVRYTGDGRHNVAELTDRAGNVTRCGYNADFIIFNAAPGRTNAPTRYRFLSASDREVTDPEGAVTRRAFDAVTRLVRIEDPAGNATTFDYLDPAYGFAPSRTTRPSGVAFESFFDVFGNVVALVDEAKQRWDFVYDARGRLVQSLAPLCTDAWGKVDPARRHVDQTWDSADRLLARTEWLDPNRPATTKFGYGPKGDLESVTDATGATTRLDHDAFGNLVKLTSPAGRTFEWLFERAPITFNFTVPNAVIDGEGQRGELHRDALGRLVREEFPDGSGRSFVYDAMDRWVRVDALSGATTLVWTPEGWLKSVAGPRGKVRCDYLANGQIDRKVIDPGKPSRRVIQYVYDAARNVARLDEGGRVTAFDNNVDGHCARITFANGATKSFVLDALGRAISIEHRDRTGALFASYGASFQENGLLKQATENDSWGAVTTRYGYDFADRLVREEKSGGIVHDAQWSYDDAGRRAAEVENGFAVNYLRDADGRLLSTSAGDLFTWDRNGRLVERVRQAQHHRFAYDFRSELTGIDLDQGKKLGWQPLFRYGYDGLARRIEREVWDGLGSLVESHDYLHGFDSIVGERAKASDGTLLLEIEMVFDGGRLVARRAATSSQDSAPATDFFGTARAFTDDHGGVQLTGLVHDAFGKLLACSAYHDPLAFAADSGWREEGDAGLLFTGGGFYDPQVAMVLPRVSSDDPARDRRPCFGPDPLLLRCCSESKLTKVELVGPKPEEKSPYMTWRMDGTVFCGDDDWEPIWKVADPTNETEEERERRYERERPYLERQRLREEQLERFRETPWLWL